MINKPVKLKLEKSKSCSVNLPIGLEKDKYKKVDSLFKKIKLKLIK